MMQTGASSSPRPVRPDAARFALLVFLGTEVMFFTALLASFLVLRAGAVARDGIPWPKAADVHVEPLLGLANTIILVASSAAAMLACRLLAAGSSGGATRAIAASLLLGMAFMGIKGYEYYQKITHGLLPGRIGELHADGSQARARYDTAAGFAFVEDVKSRLESDARPLVKSPPGQFSPPLSLEVDLLKDMDARRLTPGMVAQRVLEIHSRAGEGGHESPARLPAVAAHGNLWASCYFLITGCHALHLVIGLIFLLGLLVRGISGALTQGHLPYLSNVSLYWHFVDMVWLVVFPVIYLL
jgi:cytochrome c oxidase subunit 3